MTNKKNKHRQSNHQHQHNQPPPKAVDQGDLLKECLELHQLLKDRTAKLQKLQTGQICYILSTKWLKEWKGYVGYEGTVIENESIDKRQYGKRHPGKINTDIAANTYETRDFYSLPPEMKKYDYLNHIINQKKYKDDDYIAVTVDIWDAFSQYYEGIEIKRPVRKLKGSIFYDSQPLRCDTIFVNLEDEELEDRIKKSSKRLYESIFPSNKMQLSTIWNYQEMFEFFQQYCKHTYGHDNIRIWKGYSYMATNPITVGIVESIKQKKYLIKGRLISSERYKQNDIDEYIKPTHTLIVEIGEALTSEKEEGQPKGYCQQCVEKKPLVISCVCHQVDYCSYRCRIDDQSFHYKTCQEAFDSQSDEEYELKYSSQTPKSGLDNLGNTCYMNSVLQSLFSLDYFRTFFSSNQYLKHLNEKQQKENNCLMLRKFSKSIKLLIEQEKSFSPWALKGQINYNLTPFRGYSQHDANDFFINFLNTINDYLSKIGDKAYHTILEPFIGEFHSIVICPLCNVKSENNQIFMQVSVPIKGKVKTHNYSYCIIDPPHKNIKGRANVFETWQQIKNNLNVPSQTLVYMSRQPEGLIAVDQNEKKPNQVLKGLKGDLVFYQNIKKIEGQYLFACSLVTSKIISGMKMKSSYGSYTLISINDIQTTLGTLWLKIIQIFFAKQPQVVAQAIAMEKQYFAQIEQAVRLENEAQENKKEEKQTQGQWQQIQSQSCKKIVEFYNERLKSFVEKIGIQIYVNHFKRNRNLCGFCNKRCQNCDLPIIFDKGFEDYFEKRYQEVKFQIYLREALEIQNVQKDLSTSGEPTIHDCLALFNQPEQLDEENAWYCSNCDNMALAFKELEIKMFPPILILHLNRFKNIDGKKMKNNESIVYEQFQQFGKHKYRLVSVIIHEGSMDAGHYWSIGLRGENYYIFNDAKVSHTQKVYNKNAYILIYESINFTK